MDGPTAAANTSSPAPRNKSQSAGPSPQTRSTMPQSSPLPQRLRLLATLFALLWLIEALDWVLGRQLDQFGLRPREWTGLWGIPLMPLLHGSWSHLAANSIPFLLLGWLTLLRGTRQFLEITLSIILVGGLGTWLIGKPHSIHVGASGLIFGYFGFLLLCGLLEFSLLSILSAVVVGFLYGGLIWGVLPSQPGVSWESHLCGFLAGLLCAWITARNQPARRPRFSRKI